MVSIASYALFWIVALTHPRGVALEFYNYPLKTTLAISAVMVSIVTGCKAGAIWVAMRAQKRRQIISRRAMRR